MILIDFKKAKEEDLQDIMNIIYDAQEYFKKEGIDQWQNNYPNKTTIINDIQNNMSYILKSENRIAGTVYLSFEGEKTYNNIYDGEWTSNLDYAVIHRIAIDPKSKGKGHGSKIINEIEKICLSKGVFSIRIDTHIDNKPMIKLLNKNKFSYCGIIYLDDGSKRIAFEKLLN